MGDQMAKSQYNYNNKNNYSRLHIQERVAGVRFACRSDSKGWTPSCDTVLCPQICLEHVLVLVGWGGAVDRGSQGNPRHLLLQNV